MNAIDMRGRSYAPRGVAANQSADGSAAVTRTFGAEPRLFLIVIDLLALVTAFSCAYVLAPSLKEFLLNDATVFRRWVALLSPEIGGEYRPAGAVAWVLLVTAAITVLVLQGTGGYRPLIRQSRTRIVATVLAAALMSIGTITLILFALRSPSWSRLFIFLFALFSVVELCGYRLLLRWYRSKRIASGFYTRSLILVGSSRALAWLAAHVVNNTSPAEYEVVGYLDPSPALQPISYVTQTGSRILPCLGAVGQLSDLLVHRPVHEVIAVHGTAGDWLGEMIETCDYFRITLRIVPEALVFGRLRDLQFIYHSDPLRLPEIVLRPRHLDSTALFIKRLVDIVVSSALLVLLLPVFVLIAAAIKLTTPALPVFYPWRVVGYKGRLFTGYKFTTMRLDADDRKAELMHLNEMSGPVFKMKNDPRITPLGRFLRKYSLNELPQLWSVLKGDMSLVGPRPAGPHELTRYDLWHKRKLVVRPGITCLWQVRGRNQVSNFDDWVRMDFEYIDNWSFWLDLKILVRTAWTVLRGSGS